MNEEKHLFTNKDLYKDKNRQDAGIVELVREFDKKNLKEIYNEKIEFQLNMQGNEINNLKIDVKEIKEKHLPTIQVDLVKVKEDTSWLKKFFWIIATASIGGLIAQLFNLFIQHLK